MAKLNASIILKFAFYIKTENMFLSRIELLGFKSFANKTILKFSEGITAIVGPNGCGKTNIVDAIRWVLGEQKTSLLRSEVMENVIFNGSATRKQQGMAEVSITFQNDKGLLPSHFTEVTITRKLYRDGKSEYYINNNLCRLKDVLDLFIDKGMSSNSYSIIELKMIETLLNGSLDERRRLLEEAAGIAKFKQRKKETNKKLESVHNDLLRIYDIVNEIEQNVRSLSRQASKTKKYNKIYQELKSLELDYWLYQFQTSNDIFQRLEVENNELKQNKEQKEKALIEVTNEIAKIQEEISKLEEQIDEVRSEENQIFAVFSSLQNQINLAHERINTLSNNENRLQNEIIETNRLLEKFNHTYNELMRIEKDKNDELILLRKEFETLNRNFVKNESLLQGRRKDLQELNERIIKVENELKYDRLNLDRLLSGKRHSTERFENLKKEINDLELTLNKKSNLIENIKLEIKTLTEKLDDLNSKILQFEKSIEEKKVRHSELLKNQNELQLSIREVQTSLDFLKSILEVDESTRFLIKESNWTAKRNFSLLGEILPIEEQFRIAYDSLLGQFKNIVLVENESDILEAKEILTKEHKGKCFFVCLSNIPENVSPPVEIKHHKIIGFASEIPNVDSKIRNLLRLILGNSLIVKDFDDALAIFDQHSVQCLVTLSGEMIINRSIQKRGSILHKEGLSIGKVERIKKLERKQSEISQKLVEIENAIKVLDAAIKQDLQQIQQYTELVKQTEKEINQKKITLGKEELLLEKLQNEFESKVIAVKSIENEFENFDVEIQLIQSTIQEKEQMLLETKKLFEERQREFIAFQKEFEGEQTKVRDLEKKIVKINTELEGLSKEKQRIVNSRSHQQSKLIKLEQELTKVRQEKEERKKQIEELERKIGTEEISLEETKQRKGYLQQQKKELEELLFQQEEYKEQNQSALAKITARMHQNEVEIARQKEISHSLFTKALESYQVNLNNYVLSSEISESNKQEVEFRISELRKSLITLGNVNFLALQEYEEQKARLELYKTQIQDLVQSEKSLKEALKEINDTAEKKFIETFEAVNQNFNKVFKELFGSESFAELHIDYNNPLDSDIEIKVKPSGKKVNSIETLSQGEKTLTVLSLLFGIYLVKPSPFCVLDEVDAPLDDANVDRFLNLLKKFSNEVQFIIITHNKRTMEFANVLYGVTMAEDGISKVLSVKLVES
ncbi:MAG: chromosome segregation protein SMC [Candidatus Kapaibacteriota bacterium]